MPDASYGPKIYRDKGGDRMVVASGGELELNGVDLITTGGQLDFSGQGSGWKNYVENPTSSASTLTAYGYSHLVNLSTALTMPLGAPSAGVEKFISVITPGTSAQVSITSTAAGADFTTAGSTQIIVSSGTVNAPTWVRLIGRNSTRWDVLGQSANVAVS